MSVKAQRTPMPYRSAVAVTCGVLFLEGSMTIILVAVMAAMARQFGVSEADISVMIALRGFGCMISLPFSGMLSDKLGRRSMILLGAALSLVFFAGMALTPSYMLGLALCFLAGIGHGLMEPSAVALLFDIFPDAGPAMSFSQMFFGGGSALTSFLAALLVQWGLSWKYLFWGYAVLCLLMLALARAFHAPPMVGGKQTRPPAITYTTQPQFKKEGVLLSAAIFVNSCGCTLLFTWIATYAQQVKGFAQGVSMQMLTGYQTGAVLSALLFAWVLTRVHTTKLMVFNPLVSIALLGAAMLTPSLPVFSVLIFLCGLLLGVTFSLVVTTGGALFSQRSGTASGMLGMANMMGNALITLVSGQALRFTGVGTLMVASMVMLGLMVALSLWFRMRYLSLKPQAGAHQTIVVR